MPSKIVKVHPKHVRNRKNNLCKMAIVRDMIYLIMHFEFFFQAYDIT